MGLVGDGDVGLGAVGVRLCDLAHLLPLSGFSFLSLFLGMIYELMGRIGWTCAALGYSAMVRCWVLDDFSMTGLHDGFGVAFKGQWEGHRSGDWLLDS